jgi:predicted nucleic acid-binding protein
VTVIADSGPLIHLSMVQQFHLLKQLFPQIATIPQVVEEVVTQGKGRPGADELQRAIQDKWISIAPVPDLTMVQSLMAPNLSETDSAVIASALAIKATAVLADDSAVRRLAEREGLPVIGTIGILTHARVNGLVGQLKPLLDQLITEGCYLDPSGRVYQDALKRAGER